MYQLDPQPVKRKSGCIGRIFKGVLLFFGTLVAIGIIASVIVAIVPSAKVPPSNTSTAARISNGAPEAQATATLTTQQIQGRAKDISFKELARNTEKHIGELLKYNGKVVQVLENSGDYELRVNVTKDEYGFWSDTVYLICLQCPTRPLEDDIISFVAVVDGRLTYKSTMGADITLPQLTVRLFDVIADK